MTVDTKTCVCGAAVDAAGKCTGLMSGQAEADALVERLAVQLFDSFDREGIHWKDAVEPLRECYRRTARDLLLVVGQTQQ